MSRRRNLRRGSQSYEEPLINLTPLIDVVFVILIMFIVVAPLLEVDQIQLAEGHHQCSENSIAVQEQSPISIHVHHNNAIYFNKEEVSLKVLEQKLKSAKLQYPNEKPQLFHDKNAYFGTYQSIKNMVEDAGFTQMDVILKPE